MRFKPAVRLHSTYLLASVFLGPLLAGVGPGGTRGGPTDSPLRSSLPSDQALVWVFLTPEEWAEAQGDELVRATGARVRMRSDWLQALSVAVSPQRIFELAAGKGARGIRFVSRLVPPAVPSNSTPPRISHLRGGRLTGLEPAFPWTLEIKDPSAPVADSTYGPLGPSLDILGIPAAHRLGFLGSGTRIGILDGLFFREHATVRSHPPLAVRDFVDDDGSVDPEGSEPAAAAAHGTALWSLVAADLPNVLRGAAPNSGVVLARIRDDSELREIDEDRWVEGLEWLESQGARVVVSGVSFRSFPTSEYGIDVLDGDNAPSSQAADEAARRGVLVVAPVGNLGPGAGSLGAPSDGDSVLSVGAVDESGMSAIFSAAGPTGDGREKPEVMAPGVGLPTASVLGPDVLGSEDGTEFAAGLLAGAAALFVEAYPERGPMEVVRALEASIAPGAVAYARVPDVSSAIIFPDGLSAQPISEVDGEGSVGTLTPQFLWDVPTIHPAGLPVTFHLQLSTDSSFTSALLTDSVVGTFARRLQRPLPPRSRFFWRIVAVSAQGIRRTTTIQGPFLVPSWVRLEVLNDVGGTELSDPRPEFRWTALDLQPPAGPFTFELQILSDREGDIIQSRVGLQETHYRPVEPLPFNIPLRWRIVAQSRSGSADTVSSVGPFVVTGEASPPVTILYQNFPNPFPRPDLGVWETNVWFDLAEDTPVELAVYDMRGRLVRSLIPGPGCPPVELSAGLYGRDGGPLPGPCTSFSWDGRAEDGSSVPGGVYLLRLRAGGIVNVRRIVYWP